jgi:molybdate transport system permease protein
MIIQQKNDSRTIPGKVITIIPAALLWLLLFLPLVALIWRTFSFNAFPAALSPAILTSIALSLRTTLISMVIILVTGTPLAYLFANYHFSLKRFMMLIIEMPIVIPPVIAGLALLTTFGRFGLLGGLLDRLNLGVPFTAAAVVLAQVFVSSPFYIRAAQASFAAIDLEIQEAAAVDGANRWLSFWRIILPMSLNSLFAGLMLSWARALGEFGATILFAGNLQGRTQTMPLLIYARLESSIGDAYLAALILLGLAFIAFTIARMIAHRLESVLSLQMDQTASQKQT